mgnify:CR=1 FL=1
MKTLSIIFPCFNEAKSIPFIFDELEKKVLRDDIEIIFIDNGSTDNTKYLLEKLTANHDFARMFSLQENKGYGYGIQYGLDRATAKYVGWMHADLQTKPMDLITALNILENNNSIDYVKGLRKGRSFTDLIFTYSMSIIESILFGTVLFDINAQPNIFDRRLLDLCKHPPSDFSFDLYYYYQAIKQGFRIHRFPVTFESRLFGTSHWNISYKSKLKFIIKTINYSISFRIRLLFKKD